MERSCSLSVRGHLPFWNMFCNAFVLDQLTRARTSIYRNEILSSISGMWMLSSGLRRTDWTLYFLCFPREFGEGTQKYHLGQLIPCDPAFAPGLCLSWFYLFQSHLRPWEAKVWNTFSTQNWSKVCVNRSIVVFMDSSSWIRVFSIQPRWRADELYASSLCYI